MKFSDTKFPLFLCFNEQPKKYLHKKMLVIFNALKKYTKNSQILIHEKAVKSSVGKNVYDKDEAME